MIRSIFAALILAGSGLAATVDGQWQGSVATPNGESALGFNFQSNGTTLTGTNTTQVGEAKITNGKIDGDAITFSVSIDAGGMPIILNYKGIVAQDQIRFTLDVMGMPMEFVATRLAPPQPETGASPATPVKAESNGSKSGVAGKWSGSMTTQGGEFPISFTFAADGTKLTGTTTGPEGDIKIEDGKIDGNALSFSVTFDFGGMPLTMSYKGVLAQDEIKFTIDLFGMPLETTVKRVA